MVLKHWLDAEVTKCVRAGCNGRWRVSGTCDKRASTWKGLVRRRDGGAEGKTGGRSRQQRWTCWASLRQQPGRTRSGATTAERTQACCRFWPGCYCWGWNGLQEAESMRAVGMKEEDATTLNSWRVTKKEKVIPTRDDSAVCETLLKRLVSTSWEDGFYPDPSKHTTSVCRRYADVWKHSEPTHTGRDSEWAVSRSGLIDFFEDCKITQQHNNSSDQ